MPNHYLYENFCLEKIRSLFQQLTAPQTDLAVLTVRHKTSDTEIWESQGKEQFEPNSVL